MPHKLEAQATNANQNLWNPMLVFGDRKNHLGKSRELVSYKLNQYQYFQTLCNSYLEFRNLFWITGERKSALTTVGRKTRVIKTRVNTDRAGKKSERVSRWRQRRQKICTATGHSLTTGEKKMKTRPQ